MDDYEKVTEVLLEESTLTSDANKTDVANDIFDLYDSKAKLFSKEILQSFLTRRTPGDKETFYTHNLIHYMPKLTKQTYERHGLGLIVFTMEGFEYKNYSSKQAVKIEQRKKQTNNIIVQSLQVLQL